MKNIKIIVTLVVALISLLGNSYSGYAGTVQPSTSAFSIEGEGVPANDALDLPMPVAPSEPGVSEELPLPAAPTEPVVSDEPAQSGTPIGSGGIAQVHLLFVPMVSNQ